MSTVTFAAAMVIVEYIIFCIYPLLGGLSDAYTQYRNFILLQIVTITGIYGISFVLYFTSAVILWLWDKRKDLYSVRKQVFIYGSVIGLIFFYGIIMYQLTGEPEKSVRIAAVQIKNSKYRC